MGFLNAIARFFWGLYDLLASPFRWVNEQFRESPRTRAFLYAVPALFAAVSGVALVTASQIGRERELVESYDSLSQAIHNEYLRELDSLNSARRLLKATGSPDPFGEDRPTPGVSSGTGTVARPRLVPQLDRVDPSTLSDDLRTMVAKIESLQIDQQTLLLKLIALDPENEEFRYRYAMAFEGGWQSKQLELMKQLAPEETPGFDKAHLWMASYYFTLPASSIGEAKRQRNKALIHAKHCLSLDKTRREAEIIKAESLVVLEQYQEALASYRALFDTEPEFFERIVALNRALGKEEDNRGVYELASQKLLSKIRNLRSVNTNDWSVSVRQNVVCMVGLGDFTGLIDFLKLEENLAEQKPDDSTESRLTFLRRLRGDSLRNWAQARLRETNASQDLAQILDLLKQARELNPNDEATKFQVALVGMLHPTVRDEANLIYDPATDPNVPGMVLQVQGNLEMQNRNYAQAIGKYEEARRKIPKNPDLLNNLAYALLMSDSAANASRALFLVDEAIALVPNLADNATTLSAYRHTRGAALMALGRTNEAASNFEIALQSRPDDEGVLESLIKCYQERDPAQAGTYQKRLDEIRTKKTQSLNNGATGG